MFDLILIFVINTFLLGILEELYVAYHADTYLLKPVHMRIFSI